MGGTYQEGFNAYGAIFEKITSFFQVTKEKPIVVDSGNHCLRLVYIGSGRTERYTGMCTSAGFKDGPLLQAKFYYPGDILSDGNRFLITDSGNDAIRAMTNSSISTWRKVNGEPRGMTLDKVSGVIYVTVRHGIVRMYLDRDVTERLFSSETRAGFRDGDFSVAHFNHPTGIAILPDDDILLVADTKNHRVRIVDLRTRVVYSICTGQPGNGPGNFDECYLYEPEAVTAIDSEVYIGQKTQIWQTTIRALVGVLGKRPDRTTTTFTTKSTVTTTTLATTPTSTTTTEKPRMERCPTTRTVAIPQGSSTADVNISPGHMVALPVGRYNISITLNNGRRCAVTLKIITGGCMFRN